MGSVISSAFIPPDELLGCDEDGCLSPEFSHEWCFGFVQVLMLMMGYANTRSLEAWLMRCLCTPNRYGYILFMASNMLSDGSELLLLVPSLAGIVGSVVLPILGAVPDGAIMLFSGLGPDAQEQLQVGVGALAGSTIMLLTIPWGGCIFAGAMPLSKSGEAIYSKKAAVATKQQGVLAKLSGHGVTPEGTIKSNAFVMAATSVCYLIIQGPAFQFAYGESGEPVSCLLPYPPKRTPGPHTSRGAPLSQVEALNKTVAKTEHWWSLAGLVVAIAAFVFYISLMVAQSGGEVACPPPPPLPLPPPLPPPPSPQVHRKLIDDAIMKQLESSEHLTLSGLIGPIVHESVVRYTQKRVDMPSGLQARRLAWGQRQLTTSPHHLASPPRLTTVSPPLPPQESLMGEQDKRRLAKLLAPFFAKYARHSPASPEPCRHVSSGSPAAQVRRRR